MMTRYLPAAVLVFVALAVTPARAAIFVKIPGIPGGSTEAGHRQEIVASSFSVEGGQVFPKNGPKRCAPPSNKTQLSGISIEKVSDVASAKLFMAAAQGTLFSEVVITVTDPASKGLPSERYVLSNAFIGTYSASAGDDPVLEESLTFYFRGLEYTHFDPEETATWAFCGD